MKKILIIAAMLSISAISLAVDNTIYITAPANTRVEVIRPEPTIETGRDVVNPDGTITRVYYDYNGRPIRRAAQQVVEGAEEILEAPLNLIP